jgi:predicted N-formylglutamate amidohydrolase
MSEGLLAPDEPAPVLELGGEGRSAFVIVVDHASDRIPRRLGNLDLEAPELERHIAWDIGALALAQRVAVALDAKLVAQNYSRLVVDCNRHPRHPEFIPLVAESTRIPGNQDLTEAQIASRRSEVFDPYHRRLCDLLDERWSAGRPTILVLQHSMTDIFKGVPRAMHASVLYNKPLDHDDSHFASFVLKELRLEPGLIVGNNEPYSVTEDAAYTVFQHAESRRLPYVVIEVRQDLIFTEAGQNDWAQRLIKALRSAEQAFSPTHP